MHTFAGFENVGVCLEDRLPKLEVGGRYSSITVGSDYLPGCSQRRPDR